MAKKPKLSRGLNDLFSDNSIIDQLNDNKSEDGGIADVRISLIEPNKSQPREAFDDEKLSELADSIRENGVLQPILVRPINNGGYQIVAGERRWRAARLAGLTEVPVYIRELDDKQTMQLALIENIQRQDLSPIEEAKAYKNLMDTYGMTQLEVSKAVGKSRSAVANSLRILNLCEDVQKMVNDGLVSAGHAKVLAGLEAADQIGFAAEVADMNLSVRQLEAQVSELEKRKSANKLSGELKNIKKNSLKNDKPFLKEFEVSVNNNSNIKVKTASVNGGGVQLNIRIDRELDIEQALSAIAEVLIKF